MKGDMGDLSNSVGLETVELAGILWFFFWLGEGQRGALAQRHGPRKAQSTQNK